MDSKKKKVLIVDDEGDLTDMVALRLEHEGFSIAVANNGKAGLKKAKEFKPDVVLLDVLMPEMDGWEVCKKLKEGHATKSIPVILFTVLEKKKVEKGAKQCGVIRIIGKPFDKNELLRTLREEIGK